jgi:hypothetical protein
MWWYQAAASGTYGSPRIAAGITGYLDLSRADGARELQEASTVHQSCPNFRGFRCPDATDAALQLLEARGLVWETGLSSRVAEVAAKFPRLRIVINHCCPRVPPRWHKYGDRDPGLAEIYIFNYQPSPPVHLHF